MNHLFIHPKQRPSRRKKLFTWWALGLGILIGLVACTPGAGETHNIVSSLEHQTEGEHSAPAHNLSIEAMISERAYLAVQTNGDIPPFFTLARQDQITQYPCSNCHSVSLDEMVEQNTTVQKAHWDIKLNHAPEAVMNCQTCHTGDDMDSLHSLTGTAINFDESYQLCAQCHGQQFKDWEGGAHGKSVGGWAPPRIVNNCVNCHNPHQPAWGTRWPAVTNASSQE